MHLMMGYVLSPLLTFEAGYMKQHVQHAQTHHFQLGITVSNPIAKKPS